MSFLKNSLVQINSKLNSKPYDYQYELDDAKSSYQLIIKITISEKKKNSEVIKKGKIRIKILTKEA